MVGKLRRLGLCVAGTAVAAVVAVAAAAAVAAELLVGVAAAEVFG